MPPTPPPPPPPPHPPPSPPPNPPKPPPQRSLLSLGIIEFLSLFRVMSRLGQPTYFPPLEVFPWRFGRRFYFFSAKIPLPSSCPFLLINFFRGSNPFWCTMAKRLSLVHVTFCLRFSGANALDLSVIRCRNFVVGSCLEGTTSSIILAFFFL